MKMREGSLKYGTSKKKKLEKKGEEIEQEIATLEKRLPEFNPLTPKSAIWHYKTHCFSKNCNFLNRANFALSISCEH